MCRGFNGREAASTFERKPDAERRPLARLALHVDRTAVRADDPGDKAKSEPEAFFG